MSVQPEPSWERHCADLAIERVNEATGRDVWAELGGKPTNTREGAELYRRWDATCLADLVTTKVLGPPVDPKRARRGDLCLVPVVNLRDEPTGGFALGICRGEWVECIDRMQPLGRATLAWRITGKPQRQELLDCEQSAR